MSEIYYTVKTLADKLNEVEGINKVFVEFPGPNLDLLPPSISLITANSKLMPRMPIAVSSSPLNPDDNDNLNVIYSVGDYEIDIQMDIWTEYKAQREEVYNQIRKLFDSQIKDDLSYGLKLLIPEYFNSWASYDLGDYSYPDNETMALKGEWRLKVPVIANLERLTSVILPRIKSSSIIINNETR